MIDVDPIISEFMTENADRTFKGIPQATRDEEDEILDYCFECHEPIYAHEVYYDMTPTDNADKRSHILVHQSCVHMYLWRIGRMKQKGEVYDE